MDFYFKINYHFSSAAMMLKDADARIHFYSIGVSDISSFLPVLLSHQVVSTKMICALTPQICTGL